MAPQLYDAVVIGSGPNGLAAAIELARRDRAVVVYEAEATLGGGARSAELTLPGFTHDVCSAIHPMAVATHYLPSLPLHEYGLEWVHPPLLLAHPFDDGSAAVLERSGERTAERLGEDMPAYRRLIAPVVKDWEAIEAGILAPLHWPRHRAALTRFGLRALRPAAALARAQLKTPAARALWAGLAAHSVLPLEAPGTSTFALLLAGAGHRAGWPFPRGGAQAISNALAAYLRSLGGEIVTGRRIESLAELPPARAVVCDVSPDGLLEICADRLPARYRHRLARYRRAPGVYKMDWALSGPIPWTASECALAGTVHLGGTFEEIVSAEAQACAPARAQAPEAPFVLLVQPSRFDPSRAPAGGHTAWAYCHVPNGSSVDMCERIEAQIERFAPGFRALILARSPRPPAEMERHNANLRGGDIVGGSNALRQLFVRPTWPPYRTPLKGVYLCSASTPPGGSVHGLCGYYAARQILADWATRAL